ncbi:hypothetical protein [Umezawaea beigongshangensis]|uniref:hypothetical protein n=1 Tax=Umezawaea beigongshangensis TaxID=2780383 RepID=UPI0018F15F67|nr:hypothetical protein [Umezawaea beigongshangensis]
MSVMHIVGNTRTLAHTLGLTDNPRALCGVRVGTGAARNAPLCPTCVTRAGWTHDKRQ